MKRRERDDRRRTVIDLRVNGWSENLCLFAFSLSARSERKRGPSITPFILRRIRLALERLFRFGIYQSKYSYRSAESFQIKQTSSLTRTNRPRRKRKMHEFGKAFLWPTCSCGKSTSTHSRWSRATSDLIWLGALFGEWRRTLAGNWNIAVTFLPRITFKHHLTDVK